MTRQDLIWQLQQTIVDIYKENNLQCLRGLDDSYQIKDKQILVWYMDVVRKCSIKYKTNRALFDKNIDDILLNSDEILYFTGHLFLYKPFINNPLNNAFNHYGKTIYPNFQNLEGKRYSMFADIAAEKVYNYWDRIGDLIAFFFPEQIKPKDVLFTKSLEIIPKEFHDCEEYKWLVNFKETDYKELNAKRRSIVHYNSTDTISKYEYLRHSSNKEGIEKWVENRNGFADYFKKHIELSIEGFYMTLKLLEKISDELFKDIDLGKTS